MVVPEVELAWMYGIVADDSNRIERFLYFDAKTVFYEKGNIIVYIFSFSAKMYT